ncbi:hypothetical protein B5E41_30650 [Rhizobium esperanzae]|uniref:Uncharacterized protein n=1 Tax=Rhizobium esperanzae TaxID=1967781 RepID=A0A2D0AAC0_9HYPH|nr:hypothetical protein B5E41_30650 [Rhizobium esperanzae]
MASRRQKDGPASRETLRHDRIDAERQIPRLIAGKFDVIISSMSATAKPEEITAFSDSTELS